MTPTPPPQKPQTLLGSMTQAVRTVQAKINFSKLKLKPNARVPELWVQTAEETKADVYPLLGDRYLLGRSSQSCDIVVRNPVVSQVHLSLNRDSRPKGKLSHLYRAPFVLRDENSTNGIYRGKRRVQQEVLKHGAVYTLGPTELAASVRVKYVDPPPWYVRSLQYGMYGLGGITALTVLGVLVEWQKFSVKPLPPSTQGPIVVYARDGEALNSTVTRPHTEFRRLPEYPKDLQNAVIASEDSRFYWHLGVDPIGTLRALLVNLRGGELREGGSGLTQQLARSLFRDYVGTDDTAARKLREAAAALKLETFYSKDELLLLYMNRIYLGNGIYGFEDAAQFYFGKSAKELSLSEAATLVGMLPGPNLFNPIRDKERAIKQRDGVLQRLVELGMVSPEDASRARRSRIEVNPKAKEEVSSIRAPYAYGYVFDELAQLLGEDLAKEGNFFVETSVDLRAQQRAETALRDTVNSTGANAGFSQGAIATIDSKNGEIVALAGGIDYSKSEFNRATQAYRQPGSTFKVFAYVAALKEGISPGTTFSCAPLNWEGQSYAGCRSGGGSTDMYQGVAQSENVVALRVAQDVGLNRVVDTARSMGIQSKLAANPGLVLGQSEVTLLELTGAYSVLANRGVYNPPRMIRRIYDGSDCKDRNNPQTCRLIYSRDEDSERDRQVLEPAVADTMTELLRGVVQSGTGRSAAIGMGEVGKTGTNNDNVDLWFVGYIPGGLVTGVWLGNDQYSATSGTSAMAADLWGRYMARVAR